GGGGRSGGWRGARRAGRDRPKGGGLLAGIARLAGSFGAVGRPDTAGTLARLVGRPPMARNGVAPVSSGEQPHVTLPCEAVGRGAPTLPPRRIDCQARPPLLWFVGPWAAGTLE